MQEEDNKGQEPIKAYISELIFNDGNRLSVKKDDIVLFVGPNNAGKSQSLNDIYSLSENNYKGIVITGISIEKTEGSLKLLLEAVSSKTENMDYNSYYCMGNGVDYFSNTDSEFLNYDGLGQFRNWFVVKLDTATRLSICFPTNNIGRKDAKENPIHYAAFEYNKYGKWLSENFKKAFGSGIIANSLYGSSIPLCIGDEVHFDEEFDNETERTDKYASILSSYKQVQNQGDGIRSFTGILLYLMLQYLSIYLIDEPESFLHPPQARIMGQIIGETLNNNQQAFISTHSEEIVKGLLDVCGNRLRIVRITREEDVNTFSILDSQKVMEIFDDPLLKYSNIMSSIFHKTVVLCESDSDCKLYSIIDGNIKQEEGKYSETLFIHCGGKHRMPKTAKALLSLDIDVRLIPDMDVMNDENVFKSIVTVFGLDWVNDIEKDYRIISSNLHSSKEKIWRDKVRTGIKDVLDGSKNQELSQNEIDKITEQVKKKSKWDEIKHLGEVAIPSGDATKAFGRLNQKLKDHKIYLVPVGQLEGFIKEEGGHGPGWVNDVLEKYSDLNDEVYDRVREFIRGMGI